MTQPISITRQLSAVETARRIFAQKSARTLALRDSEFEFLLRGLEAAYDTLSEKRDEDEKGMAEGSHK